MEPITISTKTSGVALVGIIRRVIKDYSNRTRLTATLQDFCNAAGISRQQIYLYRRGHQPAREGLAKVAEGFRIWGYQVNITEEALL